MVELKGVSARRQREQAAVSRMPDVDGMHTHIFESLQLGGLYVGDLLYLVSLLSDLTFSVTLLHFCDSSVSKMPKYHQ